jgi:hypothetical protein
MQKATYMTFKRNGIFIHKWPCRLIPAAFEPEGRRHSVVSALTRRSYLAAVEAVRAMRAKGIGLRKIAREVGWGVGDCNPTDGRCMASPWRA